MRRRDTPLLDVAFKNMSAIDEWATKTFNMSLPTKVNRLIFFMFEIRIEITHLESFDSYFALSMNRLK